MNSTVTTPPPRVSLLDSADDRYVVHDSLEIEFILRSVQRHNALMTVYVGSGGDFFVTSVLDVLPREGLVFDCAPDAAVNARAGSGAQLSFATADDRVLIQFSTPRGYATEQGGKPALRSELPARLLRLQRREFFRLTTPIVNPLKCTLSVQREGQLQRVTLRVLDISGGGISVSAGPHDPHLETGVRYPCTLDLPDTGIVHAELELRSTFEVTMANGTKSQRSGCAFVGLTEKTMGLIQRYILQEDRARRVKLGGLR